MAQNNLSNKSENYEDMLIYIAELYYLRGLSQQQIADITHQSRTNISRLLKICVEKGIVEFRIKKPTGKRVYTASQLEQMFNLKKAIVVPNGGTPEQLRRRVAVEAGEYLGSILKDDILIGINWGSTVYEIVKNFAVDRKYDIDVIQLLGGVNSKLRDADGQHILQAFSSNFNGTGYILNAPFIVQNKEIKQLLMQEPPIKEHFSKMKKTDIAILGIGNHTPQSSIYNSGYLTDEEMEMLKNDDAVTDICGYGIDIEGNPVETVTTGRIIGIELDILKTIPVRIGCLSGVEKSQAVLGALRGGYINVLVIDEETANAVMIAEVDNKHSK
ncbi:MAG: sugar-binding transcriptional regulator [Intestinibacter sp.]|uniref:sugar-binding transcriptional regulator n=1 Tax=Intestinibacter sp. TaxID=1965304 RepID=UPI003F14402B